MLSTALECILGTALRWRMDRLARHPAPDTPALLRLLQPVHLLAQRLWAATSAHPALTQLFAKLYVWAASVNAGKPVFV